MSTHQLLPPEWKPATWHLRRFDSEFDYCNLRIMLVGRLQSILTFAGRDTEADRSRRYMQAALASARLNQVFPAPSPREYQLFRRYHIDPLGRDESLVRGLGVEEYFRRFDDQAVAIRTIGAATCFMCRAEEQGFGASVNKAKRFVRDEFRVSPTRFGEYWKALALVCHLCAALYHIWGDEGDLWTDSGKWRKRWQQLDEILTLLEVARDFERRVGEFSNLQKYWSSRSLIQSPNDLWSVQSIIGDEFPAVLWPTSDNQDWKKFFVKRSRQVSKSDARQT